MGWGGVWMERYTLGPSPPHRNSRAVAAPPRLPGRRHLVVTAAPEGGRRHADVRGEEVELLLMRHRWGEEGEAADLKAGRERRGGGRK